MNKRRLELGDIFQAELRNGLAAYFQWIAIDESQLRSDVIRVFSLRERSREVDLAKLLDSEEDFYAHCVLKVGLRSNAWKKVGNGALPKKPDVVFRSSRDFGRDDVVISKRWSIWRVSEPRLFVGELTPDLTSSTEPGEVFPPAEIIFRMEHGRYEQPYQA
jgi:hypothetical protein